MVSPSDEHVSLSVLDRSLRLVRVPRARLNECMHAVVRLLWFREAGDPFFSLTATELELSIFAEEKLLEDAFGPLASSSQSDTDIVIDSNVWLALQVEQHSEDWEASGARVKDISAPLAREGISIMFLATRYSDFLICKEHRLAQVLGILQENGFGFAAEPDANASHSGRASPMMRKRTNSPTRSSSVTGSLVLTRTMTTSTTSSPVRPNSGSRDPMTSSIESLHLNGDDRGRSRRTRTTTTETLMSPESDEGSAAQDITGGAQQTSPSPDMPRSFPKSDSATPVANLSSEIIASSLAILPDELVTVGLASDYENVWREKLVRALFFCEDVLPRLDPLPLNDEDLVAEQDDGSDDEKSGSSPFSKDSDHSGTSRQRRTSLLAASFANSITSAGNSHGTSSTARPNTPASDRIRKKHPTAENLQTSTAEADYPVPFFGFTQTVEGASLTADIRLLRALFSPSEESSLVYATGEGGLSAEWLGEIIEPTKRSRQRNTEASELHIDQSRTLLKCLQLDLSQFGLDRHGIVNSFADMLTDEGINLLYTSTFRTACVLVGKSDLSKARRVLAAHSSAC